MVKMKKNNKTQSTKQSNKMKYLVCIDNSNEETSLNAFHHCLDLLKKDEDELFVLSVATPVTRNLLRELLLKYGRFCREQNVSATMLLGYGNPVTVVNNEVKERGIDVVVVGRRTMSAFKRFFLGSTSKSIIESCPCTVLIAREFPEPERYLKEKEAPLPTQTPVGAK
jgi:nucleotide-binding universal stress UspA family protein